MQATTKIGMALLMATGPALGPATALSGQATCRFRGTPEALAERSSPLDSVLITLDGDVAKLCYGRPSARGRTMVGELDPLGSPWRMGANEPTTIHLPFEASIGGVVVGPGAYSLYAIPEDGPWTIVVNGNTSRWGIPISPDVRRSDIGSFAVSPEPTASHVETLTFRFEGDGANGVLVYAWENTTFEIPIGRR